MEIFFFRPLSLACVLLCLGIATGVSGQPHIPGFPAAQKAHAAAPAQAPGGSVAPAGNVPAAPAAEPIADPLGRSTPYGCVIGFLQAVNDNNLPKAAQYLDTKLPEAKAEELATQLKEVLDSGMSSSINGLSREPMGNVKDDLRATREKVGVVSFSDGNLDILLDRVDRSHSAPVWLFSSETLAGVPGAYDRLEARGVPQYIPAPLARLSLFGLPIWRWLLILLAIVLAIVLSSMVTRLLLFFFRMALKQGQVQDKKEIVAQLKQPVRLILLAIAVYSVQTYSVSLLARHYWSETARILGTIGIAWLFVRAFEIACSVGARLALSTGAREKIAVITLARRLFKILAFFVVIIFFLRQGGVNVSAMLAGLGIGGIALALAAQKTLEDLFGGISIIMRDSIRVGDSCRIAEQNGVIEDVGLSSTRLRTDDRTVVSIPNAKIAQLKSENFTLRDKFWFHHVLPLRCDTSKTQVEGILTGVKALLEQSHMIEQGNHRTNMIGISAGAFQIEVFAYILVPTYDVFLTRQQELLLNILAIVSDARARLAFPSQTLYLEDDDTTPATAAMRRTVKAVQPPTTDESR